MVILSFILASVSIAAPLSTEDVLAMMARVPNECMLYGESSCPHTKDGKLAWGQPHYEKLNDAREIAEAIAGAVDGDREWAAKGVIYAAYESGNKKTRVGDGGKSRGAWQVKGLSDDASFDPAREFPVWLAMARRSEDKCGGLELIASGDCNLAKEKVRHRAELVPQVMALSE